MTGEKPRITYESLKEYFVVMFRCQGKEKDRSLSCAKLVSDYITEFPEDYVMDITGLVLALAEYADDNIYNPPCQKTTGNHKLETLYNVFDIKTNRNIIQALFYCEDDVPNVVSVDVTKERSPETVAKDLERLASNIRLGFQDK